MSEEFNVSGMYSSMALLVGGVTSTGGLAALIVKRFRSERIAPEPPRDSRPDEDES